MYVLIYLQMTGNWLMKGRMGNEKLVDKQEKR
jgi:hypothetical protein